LLPRRIRDATYVLYAFFRVADDVVDDPDPPAPKRQYAELTHIEDAALGRQSTDDPVLEAFRIVRERNDIPAREVKEFVSAMRRDVATDGYETHDELSEYLRGSSVAVANMMLYVMDPEDFDDARPHARALAEAFQLTNFLRDVREDVSEYGRIYLPRSRLDEYGVTDEEIEQLSFTDEFAAVVRAELDRTEKRYREGVDGIAFLPEECRFAVLLAAVLYADHHRLIRAQDYDVLSARPALSTRRRLTLCARTWWHWRRTNDPRAAFDAASTLPSPRHRSDGSDRDTDQNASTTTPDDQGRSGPVRNLVNGLRSLLASGK